MIKTPDLCPYCGYDMNYKGHVDCPGNKNTDVNFWKDVEHNKLMQIISGKQNAYQHALEKIRPGVNDEKYLNNLGIKNA